MRGLVARPSGPYAAVLPQRGGQCDGQPALVPGALGDRLLNAVGNYDQAAHLTELHGLLRRTAQLMSPTSERSEEHTSELQSLMRISYAVFCLKKKQRNKTDMKDAATTNTLS